MADLVGGAVVGAIVSKLLDELLDALKDLKNRDENLHKLELLFQRLQPLVRELEEHAQEESIYPARQWLDHLQGHLKTARDLMQVYGEVKIGIRLRLHGSREFVTMYETISGLLSEASIAQWATGLSSIRNLRDDLEHARNDRAEMKAALENLEQRILEISEAVTSEPPRFRTMNIKRTLQNDAFPSSTASSSALSSSNPLEYENQHWNRESDISEPTVYFGGDDVARQLISNLVDPERYGKWRGIWAMGGAGKTFTARKIYNHNRIRQHFKGGRYWVTVSKDQPPSYTLLKELFAYICGTGEFPNSLEGARALLKELFAYISGEGMFPDSLKDPRGELKRRLDRARGKVLLILDDVWNPRTLEDLDLISGNGEGVILVTTRDGNNLKNVMHSNDIFQIAPLSKEDSWKLFSWHAFRAHKRDIPLALEDVAKAVADECKGLPLALQVIGSTMANIRLLDWEVRQLGKTFEQEWKDVLEKLRRANVGKGEYEALYHRLQLSVDNLIDEHPGLQNCFFYFAAFPEDYEVDMELLVSIWIAEDIVGNEQHNLAYRRREGRALVGLLVSKSMIELVPLDETNRCKMHDVMRDLAHRNLRLKVSEKHDLAEVRPSDRKCLYAAGSKSKEFPEEWTTSGTECSVERLSLHSNDLEQLPEKFNARSLRVLILTGNRRLQVLPPGFFKSLSRLTVLDLSCTGIKQISGVILLNLNSLVLLNLAGCESLQKISDRIGDLQSLQSINLDGCDSLQKLPRMKSLTKLHTLSVTRRLYSWTSTLLVRPIQDIRHVFQLRTLKRLRIWDHYGAPFPDISPLEALEELEMEDVASFPPGMSKLRNLKTLRLHILIKYVDRLVTIPVLEKLPLLENLEITVRLTNAHAYLPLPESFGHSGAFPSLRKMSLRGNCLEGMETFTFHHGAMPKLQRLTMELPSSGQVPTSVTVLGSNLNFLRILGQCKLENLELIFSEPSKFSNLEYLELYLEREDKSRLPSTIASLPRLRWLQCNIEREREKWPHNLAQVEKQGKVKIDIGSMPRADA